MFAWPYLYFALVENRVYLVRGTLSILSFRDPYGPATQRRATDIDLDY